VFVGASGKVACCDGLWWLTVRLFMGLVVGWHCYNRILTAVDVRAPLTEKRLVSNYIDITIMSDSKQHQ
jgi:hypothetical protein